MKPETITISVLIEGDRVYTNTYQPKQKIQVVINQAIAHLNISSEGRTLRRPDGTIIPPENYNLTIEELGIINNETLKFFKGGQTPDRDKRFA